jgi:hypothetical protein
VDEARARAAQWRPTREDGEVRRRRRRRKRGERGRLGVKTWQHGALTREEEAKATTAWRAQTRVFGNGAMATSDTVVRRRAR